jgi:hypothetical protein
MSESASNRKPARNGPFTVYELAVGVLDPVIARRAGMRVDLLAAWPELVGPMHAPFSRPEKIVWPRSAADEEPFQPGMLVVACEGARAVLFQHETLEIIERVNAYFGFKAVNRIRIVQKPVPQLRPKARLVEPVVDAEAAGRIAAAVSGIADGKLRKSLEKLGRGVFSRRNAS